MAETKYRLSFPPTPATGRSLTPLSIELFHSDKDRGTHSETPRGQAIGQEPAEWRKRRRLGPASLLGCWEKNWVTSLAGPRAARGPGRLGMRPHAHS